MRQSASCGPRFPAPPAARALRGCQGIHSGGDDPGGRPRPTMSEAAGDTSRDRLVATGIPGLDNVLGGGFTPDRVYLVEGNPGSGKTTLALQFLLEGRRAGESCLYVTLSETKAEL